MNTIGKTQSLHVDIPQSEVSMFEFIARKMGWKIRLDKEITPESQEEKELFFSNSRRAMAKHMDKYLSE